MVGGKCMSTIIPRIPVSCPPGFKGRYTVASGDTIFNISQIFRVSLGALITANHHISNPNVIYPGDVLCVPGLITIPCCVPLNSRGAVPFGTGGVAFVNFAPGGGQSISVIATLPLPSFFGDYDIYIATAFFKEIGGFGNQLFPTPEDPPTWSARIELPVIVSVSPDVQIAVQPSNSTTGISGHIILFGDLKKCNQCNC
jgi:hypothetical protein